jgi:hypothetical protein
MTPENAGNEVESVVSESVVILFHAYIIPAPVPRRKY